MNPLRFFSSALSWAKAHKVWAFVILLVVIGVVWGAFSLFGPKAPAQAAVIGQVSRGTVVATVSGSGQVEASNQVALTPAAGGTIVSLPVVAGQQVSKGQLIAATDPGTTGFEAESAKISYDQSVTGSKTDLTEAQAAAASALSSAASDMTKVLDSLGSLYDLSGYLNSSIQERGTTGDTMRRDAETKYDAALYDSKTFRTSVAAAAPSDAALTKAITLAQEVADASVAAQNTVIYFRDREPDRARIADPAYTSVTGAVTDANSSLSSLTSAAKTLLNLEQGGTDLTLRSAQLSLDEKAQAYQDHFVYAPFDGVIAKVTAKVGDASGSSGVATIVTKDELVSITLNEVDVAKVKLGQKATITFDAIDGLSITGTVASVDGVGTVSQGVVSYGVEIALDTQDDRVLPGMTANADIQTDVAADALVVPSSAVHTANGTSYVLVLPTASSTSDEATQAPVTLGITDGTSVEVTSGLTEGEAIVVRQATAATAKSAAAAATTRGAFGGGAAAGAARPRAGFGG